MEITIKAYNTVCIQAKKTMCKLLKKTDNGIMLDFMATEDIGVNLKVMIDIATVSEDESCKKSKEDEIVVGHDNQDREEEDGGEDGEIFIAERNMND